MIWHSGCWLTAECQICHENNLLFNAQLKVIKAWGGENWVSVPQQVPQARAEQGVETTVMLQTCRVHALTPSYVTERALEAEGETPVPSYSGDLSFLLLSS